MSWASWLNVAPGCPPIRNRTLSLTLCLICSWGASVWETARSHKGRETTRANSGRDAHFMTPPYPGFPGSAPNKARMVAIIETEWKSGTWRPWLTTFAPILVGKPNDFEPLLSPPIQCLVAVKLADTGRFCDA